MKNRFIISLSFILCVSLHAQENKLTDQELDVIKNYQFDMADSDPSLFQLDIPEPSMKIEAGNLGVDLLPLEIEEISYSIKPIAHQPNPLKYYRVYGDMAYGNLNNIDANVSFRNMVPNYFIYGFEGQFSQIKDEAVLDRSLQKVKGKGMLQYFFKQKTFFDLRFEYTQNEFGVFGFNDDNTISSTGENRFLENQIINTSFIAHHQIGKGGPSLEYAFDINHLSSITDDEKEVILTNGLKIDQELAKGYAFALDLEHNFISDEIGDEATTSLTKGILSGKMIKPKFGVELSGLTTYQNNKWSLYPNGRLYFKSSEHLISLSHTIDVELFTYAGGIQEIQYINTKEMKILPQVTKSIGGSYEFKNENGYLFNLGASYKSLENAAIYKNSTVDRQLFDVHFIDFDHYQFGLNYTFPLLGNLSFSQNFQYRLLEEKSKEELPGFQNYNLISSLDYSFRALKVNLSYNLGDFVSYSNLQDYKVKSDYQHELDLRVNFEFSKNITAFASGVDLLDNRFEQYAGYEDFGKRYQLGVMVKF